MESISRSNPILYNDFIRELKHTLETTKKTQIWVDVAEQNLGLVSKLEHEESTVTKAEAEEFLLQDIAPNQANEKAKVEDEEEDLVSLESNGRNDTSSFTHYIVSLFLSARRSLKAVQKCVRLYADENKAHFSPPLRPRRHQSALPPCLSL
jgi:hypothetical protein